MDKKQQQLGMNPSTASGRLTRDLLFKFASKAGEVCFHCRQPLDRETFSVEHKLPWLDSDDPKGRFFNLDNIAFSHQACNYKAARKPTRTGISRLEQARNWKRDNLVYDPILRHNRYLRTGN